jgi:chemotaxis protein methyltransferase CheR
MSDADFERISELAYLHTGIVFTNQKKEMISQRLSRRLRELGLASFRDYFSYIDNDKKPEVSKFINAVSTNIGSFFSEPQHFNFLAKIVSSEWVNTKENKTIRIWSAGCFTGEEPYSIAMILKENLKLSDWNCEILATDLDPELIVKGRHGVYDLDSIGPLGRERKEQFFLSSVNNPSVVKVKSELQSLLEFKCLNLLDDWPIKEKYDLIFCRNVITYFNESIQLALLDRFADSLVEGGYFIMGCSEDLNKECLRFKLLGDAIYQKIK